MEIHWQMLVMILVATRTLAIVDLRRQKEVSTLSAQASINEVNLSRSQDNLLLYLEVTKPIELPKEEPCSVQLLHHDFGYTYGGPPVLVEYSPPPKCKKNWRKAVMEWKATCKGRQYDRIAGVWLSGVEILRTCTAEPTVKGIEWIVLKDITKYSSLLDKPQTLEIQLNNVVDKTYTGVYHVNITFHFYGDYGKIRLDNPGFADLILPISLPSSQIGGSWFQIENSSDVQSKSLLIPPNAYKAVLDIFVSFHSDDEFWYSNPTNEYIEANNLTGIAGNGPFREVVAFIDGTLVGAVWPFPVIYTGGVNPLFWRPVTGIGSFDLPSYEIEITPFLGELVDGKEHTFGLGVTNALDVWFVDANLHLWLDEKSGSGIRGQLIGHEEPILELSVVSNYKGLDGSFNTSANRRISSSGWVESSHGMLITHTSQEFKYDNLMTFKSNADVEIVQQAITTNSKVIVETATGIVLSSKVDTFFALYMDAADVEGNDTYMAITNLSNAFNKDVSIVVPSGSFFSSLNNTQKAEGYMIIKDNLVQSGLGSTQEMYNYRSTEGCYSRAVSVSNYTFISDSTDNFCGNTA